MSSCNGLILVIAYVLQLQSRANSVFWARALNIPLPHSYVFPQIQGAKDVSSSTEKASEVSSNISSKELVKEMDQKSEVIFLLTDTSETYL